MKTEMFSSTLNHIVHNMKSKLPSMATKATHYLNHFPMANPTSCLFSVYTKFQTYQSLCTSLEYDQHCTFVPPSEA